MTLRDREQASVQLTCDIYEGTETSASGSVNADLDVIAGGIYKGNLIENKYTEQKSCSFTKKDLTQQRAKATMSGMESFRVIHFKDVPVDLRFVLIEERLFLDLFEEIQRLKILLNIK